MYFKDMFEVKVFYKNSDATNLREWMVFLADESDYLLHELTKYCNSENIELLGGIYSGLLANGEYKSTGLIIIEIHPLFKAKVLPHMMKSCDALALLNKTAIILVDGLSPKLRVLTETIYGKLGSDVTYVGGGAGYYDLIQKPCIFDNKGSYKDMGIVIVLDHPSVVHYRHGWERLEGPFLVNKSFDNVLAEIDSAPAFDLYADLIREQINDTLTPENFFQYSKSYPFGIDLGQDVDIVRDPIGVTPNNEIICVGSIPEESDLYILEGNVDTLLKSSFEVAKACRKNSFTDYSALLFDCISRAMFLESAFNKEIGNIQVIMEKPVFGALSIGEISSLSSGKLQLHNKSTVLAVIEK